MRLSELPSRKLPEGLNDAEKVEFRRVQVENMMAALKGVTAYALSEATDRIMRNALGHKFKPEPPELRAVCDDVMKPILEARARDSYDRRILKEMAADNTRAEWTPESRACATAKWEATKAQQRLDNAAEETRRDQYDTSPDACMARLKAAAEANGADFNLDKIKNAPSGQFIQAGRAA